MKKILLIWIGAIVVLIVGGAIYGKITGINKEPEIPQTEIVYIDDNGNEVKEKVDDVQIEVKIDGETFVYNSSIWKEKPITIDGVQFESPHYLDTYTSNGYVNNNVGGIRKDEDHTLNVQSNSYYGYIFSIAVYDRAYNEYARTKQAHCDDVVLPANVKLGVSTREYVEKIYGVSKDYESREEGFITVKYYANENKRGERLHLTYAKDTGILIGIEWHFDVSGLN